MTRRMLITAVTLVAMFVAAAAASTVGSAGGAPLKGRCGAGQVVVRVNGRAECRPARTLLPRPKAADVRLLAGREALRKSPFPRFPGGQEAQRRLLAALPHMLAVVDRHTKRHPAAHAARASLAADCAPAPADETSWSFMGVTFGGNDNRQHARFSAQGRTYVYSLERCGYKGLSVPRCPTAAGDVRASSRGDKLVVGQEVWLGKVGDTLLVRRRDSTTSSRAALGKVADDARLDYVDLTYTSEEFVLQTVATQAPVVQRGTETRRVRVDMRRGTYDLASSSVSVQGDAGLFAGNATAGQFAQAVAAAIQSFRAAEAGWSSFTPGRGGFCATAVFSPASNTKKVKAGDSGSLSVHAKAREGGRASGARWTLIGPVNASFSPTSVRAPSPRVGYHVAGTPSGNRVQVTARFTSTAGVGKNTWSQPLEALPARFTGSFSGESHVAAADNTFSGTITFVLDPSRVQPGSAVYVVERVSFHARISGNSTSPCQMNAETDVTLTRPDPRASALVLGTTRTAKGYRYAIAALFQAPQPKQVDATCNGVHTTIPWTAGAALYTLPETYSADLQTLTGTYDSTGTQATYRWNLEAS